MEKDALYWTNKINEALTQRAELGEIDFKTDLSEDNARLKDHINAMGHFNGGGALVFGITRSFERASTEPEYENIISKITHLARDSQEPALNVQVLFVSSNKGKVLCLHIMQPKGLPIFIKDRSPMGGQACFKRSGSQTIPMSVEEIRDLLAISQTVAVDEGDVEESSLVNLELNKLELVIKGFKASDAKSPKGISVLADAGILSSASGQPHVTVAGWLMFAVAENTRVTN